MKIGNFHLFGDDQLIFGLRYKTEFKEEYGMCGLNIDFNKTEYTSIGEKGEDIMLENYGI